MRRKNEEHACIENGWRRGERKKLCYDGATTRWKVDGYRRDETRDSEAENEAR
jgi:hypothetical protein